MDSLYSTRSPSGTPGGGSRAYDDELYSSATSHNIYRERQDFYHQQQYYNYDDTQDSSMYIWNLLNSIMNPDSKTTFAIAILVVLVVHYRSSLQIWYECYQTEGLWHTLAILLMETLAWLRGNYHSTMEGVRTIGGFMGLHNAQYDDDDDDPDFDGTFSTTRRRRLHSFDSSSASSINGLPPLVGGDEDGDDANDGRKGRRGSRRRPRKMRGRGSASKAMQQKQRQQKQRQRQRQAQHARDGAGADDEGATAAQLNRSSNGTAAIAAPGKSRNARRRRLRRNILQHQNSNPDACINDQPPIEQEQPLQQERGRPQRQTSLPGLGEIEYKPRQRASSFDSLDTLNTFLNDDDDENTELEPAFLNDEDYPPGWLVYHRQLGVVSKEEADEHDRKEREQQLHEQQQQQQHQ